MSFAARENLKSGPCEFVYETAASKNGDTSVGRKGKFNRPNPSVPKSGMRNSVLATRTLLPNYRSKAGHRFWSAVLLPLATHSSVLNDP